MDNKDTAKKLTGAHIYLDFPSVGATENIIMAASLAEGITTIENAACEPEICDLSDFINKMGGKIKGAGRSKIVVEGVESLKGASHKIIPDKKCCFKPRQLNRLKAFRSKYKLHRSGRRDKGIFFRDRSPYKYKNNALPRISYGHAGSYNELTFAFKGDEHDNRNDI